MTDPWHVYIGYGRNGDSDLLVVEGTDGAKFTDSDASRLAQLLNQQPSHCNATAGELIVDMITARNGPTPATHTAYPPPLQLATATRGWECPKCDSVYAPWVATCLGCKPRPTTTTDRTTRP